MHNSQVQSLGVVFCPLFSKTEAMRSVEETNTINYSKHIQLEPLVQEIVIDVHPYLGLP